MTPQKETFFRSERGLSLLELLSVAAILGLLMVLAVPAVRSMGGAAGLNGEGNRVVALFDLARQHALTTNALTAVVLITDPSHPGYLRSFSTWELPLRSDGLPATSADWRQASRWETVREGIVVHQIDPAANGTLLAVPLPTNMSYLNQGIGSTAVWLYSPRGNLLGATPGRIVLAEGYLPPGAETPTLTAAQNGQPNNPYDITILNATGRARVARN